MQAFMRYASLAILAIGPITIGAYMLGFTDDIRNAAAGFQALICGAFCYAIAASE